MNYDEVEAKVFSWIKDIDTIMHTRKVVNYAMIIAREECPECMDDVLLAAYLHDILKDKDSKGNEHAIKGALLVEQILKDHFPEYNHRKILHAIRYHEDERVTNDAFIGSLWDATLLAKENKDINVFNTAKGIELALSE